MTLRIPSFIQCAALMFTMLTQQIKAAHEVTAPSTNKAVASTEYESGRGLLTLEGPSGLFLNPTSGTLPAHAFTAQYCFLLPDNSASPVMWHGAMIAYGITDWLEVGGLWTLFDFDNNVNRGVNAVNAGPLIRVRLLKDEGYIPELSIGGYCRFGDFESYSAFIAAYKRVEISRDGFFRSVGFHAGVRDKWIGDKEGSASRRSDTPVGYLGMELQLPARVYVVGEVSTTDRYASSTNTTPYAFGLQWRAGGINLSAGLTIPNLGGFKHPSFFFGIGPQLKF